MMTAVTFFYQTLTTPTHANNLLAAPGKTVSVRFGNSFLSPEPACSLIQVDVEVVSELKLEFFDFT